MKPRTTNLLLDDRESATHLDSGIALLLDDPAGTTTLDGTIGAPPTNQLELGEPTPVEISTDGIEAVLAKHLESQRAQFEAQLATMNSNAKIAQADSALQQQIQTAIGTDKATVEYRDALKELRLALHADDDTKKSVADILTQATNLAHARVEQMQAAGGDGSHGEIADPQQIDQSGMAFDMRSFMGALIDDLEAQGGNFSVERLGRNAGSPETEYVKACLSGEQKNFIDRTIDKVNLAARRAGARNPCSIPFPVMASVGRYGEAQLAETYVESVTAGAQRREPTFRSDLLVPFFRPTSIIRQLGVPMMVISNDQTLPRLTQSLKGQWLTEQQEITDGNLTFVSMTTSPHRLGIRDDITWMNLAAANAQLSIMPLAGMEMTAGMAESEEEAVFVGSGTGAEPVGILSHAGVSAEAITSNAPTFADILNIQRSLQDVNIPDSQARFAITPGIRSHLSQILRFPGNTGGGNRALYEGTRYTSPAGAGIGGDMGFIVEKPAFVSNYLPRTLGAANNEHALLYGVYQYFMQFQYSMAYLTIDDISQAVTATTRVTINKFCDNFMRLPTAFTQAHWIPAA